MNELEKLTEFCTARQLEILEAVIKHKSQRKAAKALNVAASTVDHSMAALRRKAAASLISEHSDPEKIPAGFAIKGTTTLRKDGVEVLQWVKTDRSGEEIRQAVEQFVEDICTRIKGTSPIVPPPQTSDSDLLAVFPIGDHHHGMRADAAETGANYDCKIASSLLEAAFDYLIYISPPAETALLLNLGDFTHANDSTNETPGHGNRLDVDTRYENVMESGAVTLIKCVLKLLAKYKKVIVWMMPGNHDPDAYFALAMAIKFYFHNEPRVEVDMTRGLYKHMRFGENLIASHHGHGAKSADLPLLMAAKWQEDWGNTTYRVWHCGHIHHKTVKEFPGCTVETHRILPPPDYWHSSKGYDSMREMNVIIYHRNGGEISRSRWGPEMLEAFKPPLLEAA